MNDGLQSDPSNAGDGDRSFRNVPSRSPPGRIHAGGSDDDTNKLTEAFSRIGRFWRWCKGGVIGGFTYLKNFIIDCFRRQFNARRSKILSKILFL